MKMTTRMRTSTRPSFAEGPATTGLSHACGFRSDCTGVPTSGWYWPRDRMMGRPICSKVRFRPKVDIRGMAYSAEERAV